MQTKPRISTFLKILYWLGLFFSVKVSGITSRVARGQWVFWGKAAVMHLTKISALDLAPSNVRVNSVSPVRLGQGSDEPRWQDKFLGFMSPVSCCYVFGEAKIQGSFWWCPYYPALHCDVESDEQNRNTLAFGCLAVSEVIICDSKIHKFEVFSLLNWMFHRERVGIHALLTLQGFHWAWGWVHVAKAGRTSSQSKPYKRPWVTWTRYNVMKKEKASLHSKSGGFWDGDWILLNPWSFLQRRYYSNDPDTVAKQILDRCGVCGSQKMYMDIYIITCMYGCIEFGWRAGTSNISWSLKSEWHHKKIHLPAGVSAFTTLGHSRGGHSDRDVFVERGPRDRRKQWVCCLAWSFPNSIACYSC